MVALKKINSRKVKIFVVPLNKNPLSPQQKLAILEGGGGGGGWNVPSITAL